MDCVFCRIVARTAPADIVAETPRVVAFCDAAPITRGHLLVVPRVHGSGMADLADADAAAMVVLARRLAVALHDAGLRSTDPDGSVPPGSGTSGGSGWPGAGRSFVAAGWWRARRRGGGRSGVPVSGTNLFMADGASAGQDVFHVHLHVIPRYDGDGVRLRTGARRSTPEGRAQVARRVRAALGDGAAGPGGGGHPAGG